MNPFLLSLCLAVVPPSSEESVTLELAENAVVWLDGKPATLEDFPEGCRLQIGRDKDGKVGFLFAWSPEPEPAPTEPWVVIEYVPPLGLWRQTVAP